MPVLMILVAVAILVGVFFVATGRGGELAYEHADHAPLDLGPVGATDVALLRPPTALWGYNMQVTDEALEHIAQAMRDRDVTIAFLQQRLADATMQITSAAQTAPTTSTAQAPQLTHPAPSVESESADSPLPHRAQHARPVEPADPAASQATADLPADPATETLAAEEQTW